MFEGVWNWLWDFLGWTKEMKGNILLLGLDNAGKTTLLYYLKEGIIRSFEPTRALNRESIKINNVMFNTIDLGGQENLRMLWEEYFCDVNGVMFMIDSSNSERFQESKKVLHSLLRKKELERKPFAILMNKIDKIEAVGPDVIIEEFELDGILSSRNNNDNARPVSLFPISLLRKANLEKPFVWFSEQIKMYQ